MHSEAPSGTTTAGAAVEPRSSAARFVSDHPIAQAGATFGPQFLEKIPRERIRFFFLFAAQYPLFRNEFTANWPRQDQGLLAALEPLLPSPALVC
jgi:hypothetical protein